MYDVIAGRDIYSYWGAFILNNLTSQEYNFKFSNRLDIEIIEDSVVEGESSGVILLGVPVAKNQMESLNSVMEPMVDLPFISNYHFANWGETVPLLTSIVDEDTNFVTMLVKEVAEGKELIKFKDEESEKYAKAISEGLQSHHKYDGGLLGKNLMLLAELYGEELRNKKYSSVVDMGDTEEGVLLSLQRNMKEYVYRKIEEVFMHELDSGVIVVTLFAEQHINELGRVLINSLAVNGRKVIVMIGRQTRGDDMYRIRTSEGVSAVEVARKLNNGKGKERAATVFLPKGNQAVYNTIITALNSANI